MASDASDGPITDAESGSHRYGRGRMELVRYHDPAAFARDTEATESRLSGRAGTLHLWVDGAPVSMAGSGGTTPSGVRIGPVYTPPAARGRGYASACVAALSRLLLDSGRRRVFLFTDLANPTSNHIYQDIGFRAVCDVDAITFAAPD